MKQRWTTMTGDNSSSKMDVLLEHEVNILSNFHQQLSAVLPLLWFIVRKKYLCSKKEIPPHKAKTMIIEDRGVLPYWIVMTFSLWISWYIVISHTSLFFITFLAPRSFFPKNFFIKSQKISVHVNHTPDYSTLCKISAKFPKWMWDYTKFFTTILDGHFFC